LVVRTGSERDCSSVARVSPPHTNTLAVIKVNAPSEVAIRSARVEDAQCIHDLHTSAVRALCAPHYAPAVVEGWLANRSPKGYLRGIESGATFVAEMKSQVVGFGEAIPGEVVAVFVDPAFGGRGIGSSLLRHALFFARAEHRGPVRVESTLNAVGFYERFGFAETGRSVVRRNQVEVPIVIMERNDG
jgi:GNAT superfamily N-acetyltransferase